MRLRGRRLEWPVAAVFAALALWAVAPMAALLARVALKGGTVTGIDGASAGSDQFLYLSWIRQVGESGLIANRFDTAASDAVFLQPLYFLSGLAWKLGAGLQGSLLLWKPIAVLAIVIGFYAYVARLLPRRGWSRPAAIVVALFYFSPLLPALAWSGAIDGYEAFRFLLVSAETMSAWQLWGYLHAAVVIGLMPLCMLGIERILDHSRGDLRLFSPAVLWTAAAGLLISWMHPWQGLTVLGVIAGLVAWDRRLRPYLSLLLPALAILLPLGYLYILSKADPSWGTYAADNQAEHAPLWMLLGALLPLAAMAALGARGQAADIQERILRLWPLMAMAVYFALDQFPYHAFQAMALPLAVLAVRGARRLELSATVAVALVAVVTLPGLAYQANTFRTSIRSNIAPYWLAGGEHDALRHIEGAARPGSVLAPYRFAMTVPAFTGRSTWFGNFPWTPDFERRKARVNALFAGQLGAGESQRLVRRIAPAYVVSDCGVRVDVQRLLGPLVRRPRRFGCTTVHEIDAQHLTAIRPE